MLLNRPLVFESLTTLSQKIRSRQITSLELILAFYDQIERHHHKKINAVVTFDEGYEIWGMIAGL